MVNQKEETKGSIHSAQRMQPTSKFQFTIGYKYQEIDGEVFIYDLLSNRTFKINFSGKFIWELLGKGVSLLDVSKYLASENKIAEQDALKMCESFAQNLYENRLLSKYSDTE